MLALLRHGGRACPLRRQSLLLLWQLVHLRRAHALAHDDLLRFRQEGGLYLNQRLDLHDLSLDVFLHLGQRRVRLTDELTVEDHLWPARAELTQLLQDANASTAMMSDKAKFILAFDLSKDGNVTLKVTKML